MNSSSTLFDTEFARIKGLTWQPWVGAKYDQRKQDDRLLIVGESHYTGEKNKDKVKDVIENHHGHLTHTRETVENLGIREIEPNKTFSNIHKLLSRSESFNREAFWGDVCFYNIIQRLMRFPTGKSERPLAGDFDQGWKVFLDLVAVLQPSHCLFIGVEASNHFNRVMRQGPVSFTNATKPEKVGSIWGRHATLQVSGRELPIHFIKHSGSYFSPEKWRAYLERQAPDLMQLVSNPDYHLLQ